jgi:hypothetical protein
MAGSLWDNPRMKNDRLRLSDSEFSEIERTAKAYNIDSQPHAPTLKGGFYAFKHPERKDWVFGLDWVWRQRLIRFHRDFIPRLQAAGLVVAVEKGGGKNCTVREQDLRNALGLCTAAFSRPR